MNGIVLLQSTRSRRDLFAGQAAVRTRGSPLFEADPEMELIVIGDDVYRDAAIRAPFQINHGKGHC
jgi:hypothetical protein